MKIGKEKKWDNVKEIIDLYKGSKEQYIRVFERIWVMRRWATN